MITEAFDVETPDAIDAQELAQLLDTSTQALDHALPQVEA